MNENLTVNEINNEVLQENKSPLTAFFEKKPWVLTLCVYLSVALFIFAIFAL